MIYNLHDPNNLEKIYKVSKKLKKQNKPYVFFAHADWCPHCVRMQDDWSEFIEENTNLPMSDYSPLFEGVNIVSVTDDVMRVLTTQFKKKSFAQVLKSSVKAYPTVAFVYKKEDSDSIQVNVMTGPKTTETLAKFLEAEKKELGLNL